MLPLPVVVVLRFLFEIVFLNIFEGQIILILNNYSDNPLLLYTHLQ